MDTYPLSTDSASSETFSHSDRHLLLPVTQENDLSTEEETSELQFVAILSSN